jgi:protein-S-isoprenylcysteine O-methyltransferase Ste14
MISQGPSESVGFSMKKEPDFSTEQQEAQIFSARDRLVALVLGICCHVLFFAAVAMMAIGLFNGMSFPALGRLPGKWAVAGNLLLVLQFPLIHSFFLTDRGRKLLSRVMPPPAGPALATTLYVCIASIQIILLFSLWSPLHGSVYLLPGWAWYLDLAAYLLSWIFLMKSMMDAGLGIQMGYLGWYAVWRGKRPSYSPFKARGTYQYSRQPMYLAYSLILLTGPVWSVDHMVIAAVWLVYCLTGPLLKERRYLRFYGNAFNEYRKSVPYWIPRLRRG